MGHEVRIGARNIGSLREEKYAVDLSLSLKSSPNPRVPFFKIHFNFIIPCPKWNFPCVFNLAYMKEWI
jgi:hypothetical protein